MYIIMNIIDHDHQCHYWYGGEVATIKHHKGYTFHIEALGDVRCYLLDENNNELSRNVFRNSGKKRKPESESRIAEAFHGDGRTAGAAEFRDVLAHQIGLQIHLVARLQKP